MEQFDKVTASFTPRRQDDLAEGAAAWIGKTLVWQAGWVIEDGPYAGDWAMLPQPPHSAPFVWAPLGDLTISAPARPR